LSFSLAASRHELDQTQQQTPAFLIHHAARDAAHADQVAGVARLLEHAGHAAPVVPGRECRLHRHDLVAHEVIETLQHALVERAAAELRNAGLAAEGRVVLSDPRSALEDAAKREAADLIIVGSHGRSGVTKFLLGSVASHVVSHAPCSVLVVKRTK
jgi:nucleotide-binding universal stress UspA family protein